MSIVATRGEDGQARVRITNDDGILDGQSKSVPGAEDADQDPAAADAGDGDELAQGAEGEGAEEAAELASNFEDLPLVHEVRELLAARGYNEKDPMRIYLDVAAAFDRRCQLLTNRQVHIFAAMNDHIGELKEELANLSIAMEELHESNDQTASNHTALMETFERVLKVCGQFTPFLEKAAREIVLASNVIENRSVKALLFSYLSPALALCAGFILALVFK